MDVFLKRKICNIKEFFKKQWIDILILGLLFFSLLYTVTGDFAFDDVQYYNIHGWQIFEDRSFLDYLLDTEKYFLQQGRLFFLNVLLIGVIRFVFIEYCWFQLLQIVLTCFAVLTLGVVVFEVTGRSDIRRLAMLFSIACFQVYGTYHNALIAYGGLYQILTIFLLLEIYFYIKWLRKGKIHDLVLMILFQICAVLWYETGFLNVFLVFLIYLYEKKEKTLKGSFKNSLVVLPSFIAFIFVLFLRYYSTIKYVGTTINSSLNSVIGTFLKQETLSFPLTHFLFQRNNGIISFDYLNGCDVVFAIGCAFVFLLISNKSAKIRTWKDSFWIFVALVIVLLSGAIISITTQYQNELYFGIAHMNVFFQWVAMSAVLAGCYAWFIYLLREHAIFSVLLRVIVSIAFGFIVLINQQVLKSNVMMIQKSIKYPREIISNAIKKGFLDDVDKEDIVISLANEPWDNNRFYSEEAGRPINAIPYYSYMENTISNKTDFYIINYTADEAGGAVVLGHLDDTDKEDDWINADDLYVYEEGDAYIEPVHDDDLLQLKDYAYMKIDNYDFSKIQIVHKNE